ncbi:MAG: hypothetical protein AAFQ02_11355 [Bacteroidota bacterium]
MTTTHIIITMALCMGVALNSLSGQKQDKGERHERMLEAKKEYISKSISMEESTAEQFWPLYVDYHRERGEHHKILKEFMRNSEDANIDDAALMKYIELRNEESRIHLDYLKALVTILPPEQILELERLEMKFNRGVVDRLRRRKGSKRSGN